MFAQMLSGFKVRVVLLVRMAGVLRVVRVMAILVGQGPREVCPTNKLFNNNPLNLA